ncbi:MAG: hypothetical protein IJX07_00450 [Bacillales bacterium]|nr:hypothetical protein [Bacillales bacterium]
MKRNLKLRCQKAKNVKIVSYKADIGDVLMFSYATDQVVITQHYPLIDNVIIAISSTPVSRVS